MKNAYFIILMALILGMHADQTVTGEEPFISLPKSEGSKSFDLEISTANESGIRLFELGSFDAAREKFSKAAALAQQFRDPGLGVVLFNLGLTFHKLKLHENAGKAFATAKKYAIGNREILDSRFIRFYECLSNPSISCKEQPPPSIHTEGSN